MLQPVPTTSQAVGATASVRRPSPRGHPTAGGTRSDVSASGKIVIGMFHKKDLHIYS